MDKQLSFCIAIPTLNRIDLLLPALMYYAVTFPDTQILIYDNGRHIMQERLSGIRNVRGNRHLYAAFENIKILGGTGKNIGVAAAWNILLDEAFVKHTHCLVLNDDILLHREQVAVESLIKDPDLYKKIYVCEPQYDWSAFLMSESVFFKTGHFDEGLSIYYNDNDMMRRMGILGIQIEPVPFLNPAIFNRSMSLLKDPSIHSQIVLNKEFYVKKWGGLPGEETFNTPFGK